MHKGQDQVNIVEVYHISIICMFASIEIDIKYCLTYIFEGAN